MMMGSSLFKKEMKMQRVIIESVETRMTMIGSELLFEGLKNR